MTGTNGYTSCLGVVALAASAGILAVALPRPAAAIDASIEITSAGCTTNGGPTVCNLLVNQPFTVAVSFFDISGLPDNDTDGTHGYVAFQAELDSSAGGLTFNDRPGTNEILWPANSIPAEVLNLLGCPVGLVCNAWGSISGLTFPESTFTGIILEADYTCSGGPSVNSIILRSYPGIATSGAALLEDDVSTYVAPSTMDPVLTVNCLAPTPTPTPAPEACPDTVDTCTTGFSKGFLLVKEVSGKEKLIAKFLKGPALLQTDMGNPLDPAGTIFSLCIYDDAGDLVGKTVVDRAGESCAGKPCWKAVGKDPPDGKGYKYIDKAGDADGIQKLLYKGGDSGKSKAIVKGSGSSLPMDVAMALQSAANATIQLRASDGQCLSVTVSDIKKNDPDFFKAK